MEQIRIYDRTFREVGVLMDYTSFEYSKCFREAGKATIIFPAASHAISLCVPEGYVKFSDGEMYIIRKVSIDQMNGEITVDCEGLLSLLGGTVTGQEITLEGSAFALLGALVRKAQGNLPASLAVESSGGGENVKYTFGRNDILSDMISVCYLGGVGMKLTYTGEKLLFSPYIPVSDTDGELKVVSRSLGGFMASKTVWDFSGYRNVAVVSGAEKESGGRYIVTVRSDSLNLPDTFPDSEYFDRQMLVKFTHPVSDYMKINAAGDKYFDEAGYLLAMTLSGSAALGRCRPRLYLYGESYDEDINPGELLRITDEDNGIDQVAVAETVIVTYSHGTKKTVTELVSKNALGK